MDKNDSVEGQKNAVNESADWRKLAAALRELHRALMDRSRRDYEAAHFVTVAPAELLRLLMSDPYFEWLRGLSELMVDIDLVQDAEPAARDELAAAVRVAVEDLISVSQTSEAAHPFAQRYGPYLQDDPHVAMAHAGVRQALTAWPPRDDAADTLHERHRLAEVARFHAVKIAARHTKH